MAPRPHLLLTREPVLVRAASPFFLVHLSNIGEGGAHAIRYCRRQRFWLHDDQVPERHRIMERSYTMAACDLPSHEARECQVRPAEEPWVEQMLEDAELGQREFVSAAVYADQTVVLCRLHPHANLLDVWKPRPRSWLPGQRPVPAWTSWPCEWEEPGRGPTLVSVGGRHRAWCRLSLCQEERQDQWM